MFIFRFSMKMTLEAAVGRVPTYVFYQTMIRVGREIIPSNVVDRLDPTYSGESYILTEINI